MGINQRPRNLTLEKSRARLAAAVVDYNRATLKNHSKPAFYKKRPFAYKGVFFALVAVTTMIAAGVFYYG